MNTKKFNEVIEAQIKLSTDVLINKAKEYATDDRLHNFKVAAELQGCSPKEALAGMMAKHTVSVYDMCVLARECSMEMWSEKITDSINYLLLLRAVVQEEMEKRTSEVLISDDSQAKMVLNTDYETWMKANPKLIHRDGSKSKDLTNIKAQIEAIKSAEIRNPFGGGRSL